VREATRVAQTRIAENIWDYIFIADAIFRSAMFSTMLISFVRDRNKR